MRKTVSVLVGILVVVFVLVLAAPWFLSSSMGTNLLTNVINSKIAGQVSIQDLSISWWGEQKLKDVSLKSTTGDEIIYLGEMTVQQPLLSFLFNPSQASQIRLTNLKGKLVQDDKGVTNLEDALGQKKLSRDKLKTPVYLENVNAEVRLNAHNQISVMAVGLTRQNDIKGQFSLDAHLGDQNQINLKAERFPVLLLDQTIAIRKPELSNVLLNLIGDYFDVAIDQKDEGNQIHAIQIFAKSPFINVELKGKVNSDIVHINPGSVVHFDIPAENVEAMVKSQLHPLENVKGSLAFEGFDFPLRREDTSLLHGKATFTLDPTTVAFENDDSPIKIQNLSILATLPQASDLVSLTILSDAIQNSSPMKLKFNVEVQKRALLAGEFRAILQQGVNMTGSAFLEPAIKMQWNGILREKDTQMIMAFENDKVILPHVQLILDELPLHHIVNKKDFDLDGELTIKDPKAKDPQIPTLPMFAMNFCIGCKGSSVQANFKAQDHINGTIRIDNWKKVATSPMQVDVKLNQFDITPVHALLPNHNVAAVLGNIVDADIVATRDTKGGYQGRVKVTTPKSSDGFLKNLTGKYSLTNDKDMSFDFTTTQTLGKTSFAGTFHNLFDNNGRIRMDLASISLKGTLSHFPVVLFTRLATGDETFAKKMEAVLGAQVDADITAEIHEHEGPVQVNIKGINGQADLNGRIAQGILYLNQPLKASLKVTPQLDQAVVREMIPILGSALSAEKPIELTIEPNGFKMPLNSPSLANINLGSVTVQLHKMQFARDSQLGKVVKLLGINSNTFEVWFTPIYFNLESGVLNLQRADMLIANNFPLATWGSVDFNTQKLRLTIGITGQALKNAYAIKGIKNKYMLQIPVKGTTQKPQIDTAQVATRISSLVAQSQVPKGQLIGTVVDLATDIVTNEKVPPPTTDPLPWEGKIANPSDDDTSTTNTLQDIPTEELKKGAKKLIKKIFK